MNKLYYILDQIFKKEKKDLKKISSAVKELSDIFNAESLPEKYYMSKEWFLWAYLFYFYPINVYKYLTILKYHKEIFLDKKRFLDFGAGPLTFFTALALMGLKPEMLYALDNSNKIMKIGKGIIQEIDTELSSKISTHCIDNVIPSQVNIKELDVFSFGNVLCEMGDEERRALLEKYLMNNTEKEKHILIVEPGTHESFYKLRDIERYLKEYGFSKVNGCPVIDCCLTEGDWCHENVLFPRSKLIEQIENQNRLDNRFVNFCYLLMNNKKQEYNQFSKDSYRVISNLLEYKGFYMAHLCGVGGVYKFELQKRDISNNNKNFALLRRGDIVIINDIIKKGERLRLKNGSTVNIIKRFSS